MSKRITEEEFVSLFPHARKMVDTMPIASSGDMKFISYTVVIPSKDEKRRKDRLMRLNRRLKGLDNERDHR